MKALLLAVILSLHGLSAASEDAYDDIPIELMEEFIEAIREEFADDIREEFADGEIVENLQIFSILGVSPGSNGINLVVTDEDGDDTEIKLVKIPISRELKRGAFCLVKAGDQDRSDYRLEPLSRSRSSDDLCMIPYVETSLSYLHSTESAYISEISTQLKFDHTVISAFSGIGVSIPLSKDTVFRPILLGGYSHISNDGKFDGAFAKEIAQGLKGILDDGELDSFIVGAAVELRHQHHLDNNIELEGYLRYNYLVSDVFDASDESLKQTNDFIVVTGYLETIVPTGLTLFSQDVRALGFGRSNLLLRSLDDKITNDNFIHEIGGGFELKLPTFVEAIRLRGSVIFGEDITGWQAGLAVKF